MSITISTHNGSTVDLAHDRREKWRIEQENKKWEVNHPGTLRIDLSKEHLILIDRGSLSEVYHVLFDEALKEYNDRQIAAGKKDRIIKNYLSDIRAKENCAKASKHPVYEMITTVGSVDKPIDRDVAKEILLEHARDFEKRNPNLYVVCQALHNDETGEVHVHTAYIPVARNLSRGMSVQNSLTAALKQQGIVGDKYSDTAQMKFQKRENAALEAICNKYGFEVEHPLLGGKKEHLTLEEYRIQKQIEEAQKQLEIIVSLPGGKTVINKGRLVQLEEIEKKYKEQEVIINQARHDLKAASETMKAYSTAYNNYQAEKEDFERRVNEEANKKVQFMRDNAVLFIRQKGLWELFLEWVQALAEKLSMSIRQ